MDLPPYLDRAAKSFSDPEPRQAEGAWEDWGSSEEDIDWEDIKFPAHHSESYYERRRRAWYIFALSILTASITALRPEDRTTI